MFFLKAESGICTSACFYILNFTRGSEIFARPRPVIPRDACVTWVYESLDSFASSRSYSGGIKVIFPDSARGLTSGSLARLQITGIPLNLGRPAAGPITVPVNLIGLCVWVFDIIPRWIYRLSALIHIWWTLEDMIQLNFAKYNYIIFINVSLILFYISHYSFPRSLLIEMLSSRFCEGV